MAFNSFRRDRKPAPPHYRTPSPPRRDVSPVSSHPHGRQSTSTRRPSANDGYRDPKRSTYTNNVGQLDYRGRNDEPYFAMDAFASIALATNGHHTQGRTTRDGWYPQNNWTDPQDYPGRSSKRARSEKLPSPEMGRLNIRPVTSYAQSAEDRRLEAELLLNFSREACFTVPRPSTAQSGVVSPSLSHPAPKGQANEIHTPALSPYRPAYNIPADSKQDELKSQHVEEQELENTVRERTAGTESQYEATVLGCDPAEAEIGQPTSGKDTAEAEPTVNNHQAAAPLDSLRTDDGQDSLEGSAEHVVDCRTTDPTAPEHKDLTPSGALAGLGTENDPKSYRISQSRPDLLTTKIVKEANEEISMDQDKENTYILPVDVETGVLQSIAEHLTNGLLAHSQLGKGQQPTTPSICAACNFARNVLTAETENDATSWISCDACKSWFHFACAGFRNEREVRSVDKYRCRKCKPVHGPTTYVRKSARAHSAIDYAGLNEGVLKTSDENPEHHYIKPIKDGTIKFNPENFARMRPELVTLEYFQMGDGMKEPIVIPASLNPRPHPIPECEIYSEKQEITSSSPESIEAADSAHDESALKQWLCEDFDNQEVSDYGQDALDMVIPQSLTVRTVAELYGPEMPVEVIDVKSQNGEDKKWDMRRWVDYYESKGDKVVRNVISLEVSQSKLGRLIKRPKVVRDLDLQDHVWPEELQAKGDFPKVQFYCLMSVADCFTDFHIDFGGSSVFYHILKGKKTFFFIPPHEKNLKKYEEWCMSPAQNWTFLGDQTKECYRVDLSEGDTMLIPAGWIHAVWTPQDSLVIGGNFLTNMHYEMQIRVAQIEKVTGVARKFRYPYFQKLLWYAAMKYLEEDPVPGSVTDLLLAGQTFTRATPTHLIWDAWGEDSEPGIENYHARYYSKAELDGLPELGRYLLRTALIAMGSITDGISLETRNAVKRSIPKGNGEPLDIVKQFAVWYSWKRGNENIPHWAYPDYVPECKAPELGEKKLSVAALKRLDREAAIQAWRIVNDRQSARRRSPPRDTIEDDHAVKENLASASEAPSGAKRKADDTASQEQATGPSSTLKKQKTSGATPPVSLGPACETCRKRRRACRHREGLPKSDDNEVAPEESINSNSHSTAASINLIGKPAQNLQVRGEKPVSATNDDNHQLGTISELPLTEVPLPSMPFIPKAISQTGPISAVPSRTPSTAGRAKACNDCRKSKRRCVHDENGNEDPIKVAEAAIPRPAAQKKRKVSNGTEASVSKKTRVSESTQIASVTETQEPDAVRDVTQKEIVQETVVLQDETEPKQPEHVAPMADMTLELRTDAHQSEPATGTEPTLPFTLATQGPMARPSDNHEDLPPPPISPLTDHPPPPTSPLSELHDGDFNDLKIEPDYEPPTPIPISFQHQASASSLVSPPASTHTHTDAEHSPPASIHAQTDGEHSPPAPDVQAVTPSATSPSSRHSSRAAKTIQRYTPESSNTRRNSLSMSTGRRESITPIKNAPVRKASTGGSPVKTTPVSTEKRKGSVSVGKAGVASAEKKKRDQEVEEAQLLADEESLRLIRELQAQDMGLRRRERV